MVAGEVFEACQVERLRAIVAGGAVELGEVVGDLLHDGFLFSWGDSFYRVAATRMASTSIMSMRSLSSSASFSERWRQSGGPYTALSRVTVHKGRMSRMASCTLAWYMRRTISRSISSE
ncbi:hypothetical protein [Cutibacterium phage FD3]|nr:hypothetical protein [Cutibacterium phage FD3]